MGISARQDPRFLTDDHPAPDTSQFKGSDLTKAILLQKLLAFPQICSDLGDDRLAQRFISMIDSRLTSSGLINDDFSLRLTQFPELEKQVLPLLANRLHPSQRKNASINSLDFFTTQLLNEEKESDDIGTKILFISSIMKYCRHPQSGFKVALPPSEDFLATVSDQLSIWAKRTGVNISPNLTKGWDKAAAAIALSQVIATPPETQGTTSSSSVKKSKGS